MLEQNPIYLRMLQTLIQLKEQPTTPESVSLTRDCQTTTEEETPIKIKDPGSFNIPISINDVFLGEALCDLGAKINLILITTLIKSKV